jgi:hypothetical protein
MSYLTFSRLRTMRWAASLSHLVWLRGDGGAEPNRGVGAARSPGHGAV